MKKNVFIPLLVVFFSLCLCNSWRGQNLPEPRLNLPEITVNKPIKTWAYIAGGSLVALGGAADGYNQVQRHHLNRMLEVHPNLNLDFWGVNQWKNKWELDADDQIITNEKTGWLQPSYKERFWGSSRWLVFVTDAHHLTRTVDITSTIAGVTLINIADPEKQLWQYLAESAGAFVIRSTVFWIVHDGIYK